MRLIKVEVRRRVVLALALAPLAGGCQRSQPSLVARAEVLVGESPEVTIRGLVPDAEYMLVVGMTDAFLRVWRSESRFRADEFGCIDPSRHTPLSGTHAAPDPFGILSSMRMPVPSPEDWEAPEPRNFNHIRFTLSRDGVEIATAETKQWIFPPEIHRERIGGSLVAEFFRAGRDQELPGVLLLGGSGGGMEWARRNAALLAARGFAAMSVAYFNSKGLPPDLVEVPIETIEIALDSLRGRQEVDPHRVAIVGYSKGAELALLVASRRSDVRAVVAIAPGSAVFQGFRRPDYPVISSWSANGVGLPFLPNAYDDKFFETYDGMYLWYRTLGQHDAFAAAAIPVEKINGDILLISGVDDRIWPATFMAEQIVARLRLNDFGHGVHHLAFPNAGHGIAAPPGEPLTSVAERLGGTVPGNSRARAEGWQALTNFLVRSIAN